MLYIALGNNLNYKCEGHGLHDKIIDFLSTSNHILQCLIYIMLLFINEGGTYFPHNLRDRYLIYLGKSLLSNILLNIIRGKSKSENENMRSRS